MIKDFLFFCEKILYYYENHLLQSTLHDKIAGLIQKMIGEKVTRSKLFDQIQLNQQLNLGFSQFNEILFLLGCDRINKPFFDYLCSNEGEIKSIEQLEESADAFLKIALLFFGNVSEAYDALSTSEEILKDVLDLMNPRDVSTYKMRHPPILTINKISDDKTYYLGYLIQDSISKALDKNPGDEAALQQKEILESIVEQGKINQESYLASDHMDVYVATSMREKHEFVMVSRLCESIFNSEELKEFNLRYFDPTQAYCVHRIDKGLSEGLMLKRALCTIYMAQEADTLGKDSELASTLAQGKPVIAYVPEGTEESVYDFINILTSTQEDRCRKDLILGQLRIFDPGLAWRNPTIADADEDQLFNILKKTVREYYNKRADTLAKSHPLGIQVNLRSGVANGVLVVRTVKDCIRLLKAILENKLEFILAEETFEEKVYLLLKEKISGCVFRAVTGNMSLTNSFWNHYLTEDSLDD